MVRKGRRFFLAASLQRLAFGFRGRKFPKVSGLNFECSRLLKPRFGDERIKQLLEEAAVDCQGFATEETWQTVLACQHDLSGRQITLNTWMPFTL